MRARAGRLLPRPDGLDWGHAKAAAEEVGRRSTASTLLLHCRRELRCLPLLRDRTPLQSPPLVLSVCVRVEHRMPKEGRWPHMGGHLQLQKHNRVEVTKTKFVISEVSFGLHAARVTIVRRSSPPDLRQARRTKRVLLAVSLPHRTLRAAIQMEHPVHRATVELHEERVRMRVVRHGR